MGLPLACCVATRPGRTAPELGRNWAQLSRRRPPYFFAYLISKTIETLAVMLCSPAAVGVSARRAAVTATTLYMGRTKSLAPSWIDAIGPSVMPAAFA